VEPQPTFGLSNTTNIFTRFGTPRAIISDGGSHFNNQAFVSLLKKYGITHKVGTPYHPHRDKQQRNLGHLGEDSDYQQEGLVFTLE
jgi:hypothetical protein